MEITIINRKCPICGTFRSLEVDAQAFRNWRNGEAIQKSFPNLTPDDREHLQTGICQNCWNTLQEDDSELLMNYIFSGFQAEIEAKNEIIETEVEQNEVDVECARDLLGTELSLEGRKLTINFRGVPYEVEIRRV